MASFKNRPLKWVLNLDGTGVPSVDAPAMASSPRGNMSSPRASD